jgi:hypothetical protein
MRAKNLPRTVTARRRCIGPAKILALSRFAAAPIE